MKPNILRAARVDRCNLKASDYTHIMGSIKSAIASHMTHCAKNSCPEGIDKDSIDKTGQVLFVLVDRSIPKNLARAAYKFGERNSYSLTLTSLATV